MSRMDELRQSPTPLDRFLHATVGEDGNGNPVTVLSALARLGLDPWEEASDLSKLTREGARLRLGGLLARFRDVAATGSGSTVQRLVDLLPQGAPASAWGGAAAAPARSFGVLQILGLGAGLLVLLQIFFGGRGGSGD
jgi:hypothetical protein